jgi:hypothetical protein
MKDNWSVPLEGVGGMEGEIGVECFETSVMSLEDVEGGVEEF